MPTHAPQILEASKWLAIDLPEAARRIQEAIRLQVLGRLRRRGAVVGLSGGVDSSVVAGLCARSLGPERVLGLIMPERDSADESKELALSVARSIGISTVVESIAPVLEAAGCYRRRDEAIRMAVPDYTPNHRCKLVLPAVETGARYALASLVVASPDGKVRKHHLTAESYSQIVAATNFKQRVRKMLEYYHADRLHYAVAGTPNRLEYDQGFFVKNGDGSSDFKPIAHLYKSQVYEMADYLELPAAVRNRTATTDTFSLPQSQEEFYFGVPLRLLDLCIYAKQHAISADEAALALGEATEHISAIYAAIDAKRKATAYLHEAPLLVEPIALMDTSASGRQ
jgi:NAD+ synthase